MEGLVDLFSSLYKEHKAGEHIYRLDDEAGKIFASNFNTQEQVITKVLNNRGNGRSMVATMNKAAVSNNFNNTITYVNVVDLCISN